VGCDPVPTGLAHGPGNTLYVSTLSAEVPGEGRVYVLNARTGKVKDVIGGLNGPTGVAVDRHRNVYVSELLEGAPQEEPGPGFDPSGVGQIVKIDRRGNRTFAQVTMPTGLLYTGGNLYASAWSIAGFLGIPDAGQIVKVTDRAFAN
jgi:DNA-binding beta-propeller fold protein YncE